jgi:hypothetical protein
MAKPNILTKSKAPRKLFMNACMFDSPFKILISSQPV